MFFVSCQQSDDGRARRFEWRSRKKLWNILRHSAAVFAFPRLIIWKYLRPSWCPHGLSYFFFTAHAIMTRVICKSRRTRWEKREKQSSTSSEQLISSGGWHLIAKGFPSESKRNLAGLKAALACARWKMRFSEGPVSRAARKRAIDERLTCKRALKIPKKNLISQHGFFINVKLIKN